MSMDNRTDSRSVSDLLSEALQQVGKLIQNELRLARAEMGAKAAQAGMGIGMLVGAALVTIPALVLLLMALAGWFVHLGLGPAVSDLLAGVIGLLISGGLAWLGMNRLKPENLTPNRTLDQLEQDAAAVREQTQ